jgi:predicted membrane protein
MQQQRIAVTPSTSVKLVVGLFFAAAGLLMTADNLGLADTDAFFRYWPGVLIVIGLIKVAGPSSRPFGVFALVLGAVLLALTTGMLRVAFFDLWPLLLIGAGVVLVLQAFGVRTPKLADGSTVWGILSNQQLVVTSSDFTSARAISFMGGSKIDLTGAQIRSGPAVIDVFVLMGGVELYVPDGWYVRTEAIPFMAGIEMNTRSRVAGRELIVRGFVMMGGIDIKDSAARTA